MAFLPCSRHKLLRTLHTHIKSAPKSSSCIHILQLLSTPIKYSLTLHQSLLCTQIFLFIYAYAYPSTKRLLHGWIYIHIARRIRLQSIDDILLSVVKHLVPRQRRQMLSLLPPLSPYAGEADAGDTLTLSLPCFTPLCREAMQARESLPGLVQDRG